jgi:hypothetical protein
MNPQEHALVRVTSSIVLGLGPGMIPAAADDGSVETVGGTVRLMKTHSSVRMVSETVGAGERGTHTASR